MGCFLQGIFRWLVKKLDVKFIWIFEMFSTVTFPKGTKIDRKWKSRFFSFFYGKKHRHQGKK
jgi:hypothetical protein